MRGAGPAGRSGGKIATSAEAGAASRISVTVNVEPSFGALSTITSPPINCARRRTIERPSPVPPYRRVVELSACENGSNRRACCAASRPMPVSLTPSVTRVSPPPLRAVP